MVAYHHLILGRVDIIMTHAHRGMVCVISLIIHKTMFHYIHHTMNNNSTFNNNNSTFTNNNTNNNNNNNMFV